MQLRILAAAKVGVLAVLICGINFRTQALTNIVVNGSIDGYGGWTPSNWLEVNPGHVIFGGTFSQSLNTVPGRDYIVRFAVKYSMPRLRWGSEAYDTFTNWPSPSSWVTAYRHVHASSSLTLLSFEAVTGNVGLDEVVVGWLREPARILTQPQNRSTPEGGSASFTVGADGGPPLYYQWYFNDAPVLEATNHYMVQHEVSDVHVGNYYVIVSNVANAVTSTVATLTVDPSPKEPVIVYHPESQDVPAGYLHTLRSVAIGSSPLSYQWSFNGSELADATNSMLNFRPYETNAGSYIVRVSNRAGSSLSLPALLRVYALTNAEGGLLRVNTVPIPRVQSEAPILDVDGITKLTRSNFIAQLYMGRSPEILRASGNVIQFNSSFPGTLTATHPIPDFIPGERVYAQLRAWETVAGGSYEEARARGGKFGFSGIVSVIAPGVPSVPPTLPFTSFSLRYGLPEFAMGKLEFNRRLPDRTIEWALTGEPGFRYLIEKRFPPQNWEPLVILTNDTGRVTYSDPDQQNSSLQFYRSRMLE
jgi:hypothetical protein